MSGETFDLIIVGAGPGGYVAAIRAAQKGMRTAVVEKSATLGGVCLNEGCIPSKALLDSSELFALARDKFAAHGIAIEPPRLDLPRMMARKDDVVKKLTDGVAFLFKKNKISLFAGAARLAGKDVNNHMIEVRGTKDEDKQVLSARKVILATGSEAVELPSLPFDGDTVVSARDALSFSEVPEHLLVVGAGFIGLELGSVWRRLGARVTVVETLPKMLPKTDGQVAEALMRALKKQGFKFLMESRVTGISTVEGKTLVRVAGVEESEETACDKVLVAVGRRPVTAGLGLEEAGVKLDQQGRVTVNADYETSVPGVYAIGDLVAGPMLAHKAMEEGVVCVERMTGEASEVEYDYLPGICYTWPEAASVGKSEEDLKEAEIPYAAGRFNFMGNGRARCMDETEGFVKVLASRDSGKVLGIHIIGPRASDMIAEAVTVMTYGGTAADVAMTFHAHPTLSEAMKEAALDVEKRAIHA
ncbi:MAG TPA: dihydrolipoyl dehydrogenase [Geobacteraceae bacterium]|nr:dihydrolipoyl dehydrogenase [Geobacteraceae bacterium]